MVTRTHTLTMLALASRLTTLRTRLSTRVMICCKLRVPPYNPAQIIDPMISCSGIYPTHKPNMSPTPPSLLVAITRTVFHQSDAVLPDLFSQEQCRCAPPNVRRNY